MIFHIFKHFRYKINTMYNLTLPSHKTIFAYMKSHWKNQAPEELIISFSNDKAYDLGYRRPFLHHSSIHVYVRNHAILRTLLETWVHFLAVH